jgi:hypothetical protein
MYYCCCFTPSCILITVVDLIALTETKKLGNVWIACKCRYRSILVQMQTMKAQGLAGKHVSHVRVRTLLGQTDISSQDIYKQHIESLKYNVKYVYPVHILTKYRIVQSV